MRFLTFAVLRRRIRAIPMLLKDKRVPFLKKLLVIAGLVYLFLPLDLIPPIVPVFGFLDDIILWVFLLYYLRDELDQYDIDTPSADPSVKYKDKNVVDVHYAVKDEENSHE
ncbi:MAG: DUF1232 domain-containing protein [Firmicutes bacterium]|nr:DUF1232 domain-containing protein [Bacillota bacterium]